MKKPVKAPKKRIVKVVAKGRKMSVTRIVEDEEMLILTPKQCVELADELQKLKVPVPQPVKSPNLLSPELYGWELVESFPKLFLLYRRGIEYRADLSDELAFLDTRFKKGQQVTKDYGSIMKLQRGLFFLMVRKEAQKVGEVLEDQLLADFIETIGTRLHEAWHNASEPGSKNQADNIKNLFSTAIDGLMRLKFPEKARCSGANHPKERIAIAYARELCERIGRHPTKSEVRSMMENDGHGYVVLRGREEQKWRDFFLRSGLEGLKL
jgi:hypothetical protein